MVESAKPTGSEFTILYTALKTEVAVIVSALPTYRAILVTNKINMIRSWFGQRTTQRRTQTAIFGEDTTTSNTELRDAMDSTNSIRGKRERDVIRKESGLSSQANGYGPVQEVYHAV